jgi:hypothetical protein
LFPLERLITFQQENRAVRARMKGLADINLEQKMIIGTFGKVRTQKSVRTQTKSEHTGRSEHNGKF